MRKAVCGCFAFFKPQVPGSNAFLLGQLSSPLNGVYFVEVSQLSYHSCGTSIAHASEALIHRTVPSPVPYYYHALYGGVHNVPSVSCSHITAKCSRCYITKVVLYIFSGVFRPAGVPCVLMLESPTIVLSVPTFNFVRLSTHARYERSYRPDDEAYCGNG